MVAELSLDDRMSKGLRTASRNVGVFEKGLGRAGKGVGQIGAGFAKAGLIVGGAAVTGLAAAGKAAIDFQDAFAGVRKTVDEADLTKAGLSFDKLALSFRKMATEIPIAATEFARIGETAGALGIKATDIEAFTRTVALLGVTTNLTSDEAAESLGKVGTILGLTGKGFQNFADILVNLGNKGASTEVEIIEIAKRFGAAGKQAGLSTAQILAFSSAIASAGVEAEAGGSSLSRIFGNLITETARATPKAKAFAKVAGKSFKDFSKLVKKDTVGAMLLFLKNLKGLDKFAQQKALKSIGITNVRDRNAILLLASTYDKNLIPALKNASESTGALAQESQKRFDTIASKLQLFKQNILEAGITIGEGFLPALGRATDKLIAFLKVDANKSELKRLGEDIGKAIDNINWGEVLDGARELVTLTKGALGFAKQLFDAFNALPGPIKEATAGFLVLDKLSGGLLHAGAGNVVGGLAETIARTLGSKLPGGVGKLFVQPVFVTNFPPGLGGVGGVGGAAGAKGGLGTLSKLFLVGEAIGLIAAVNDVRQQISDSSTQQAQEVGTKVQEFIAQAPSRSDLQHALDGVNQGINDLQANPLLVLVQGDALEQLKGMRAALKAQLDRTKGSAFLEQRHGEQGGKATPVTPKAPAHDLMGGKSLADIALAVQRKGEQTVGAVDSLKGKLSDDLSTVKVALSSSLPTAVATNAVSIGTAVATAGNLTNMQLSATAGATQSTVRSATAAGAQSVASTTRSVGDQIVSAIWAAAAAYQTNVTNVQKTITIQQRVGNGNGSYGTPAHDLFG